MKKLILGLMAATLAALLTNAALHAQETEKRQAGGFMLEDVPIWNADLQRRMQPYLAVRAAALQSVGDDGRSVLITTRFGQIKQLHVVNRPMGVRRQVTFFNKPILWGAFVPGSEDRHLVFLQDPDGNERWQLYQLDLTTNRTTLITDGRSRHESPVISTNGRMLAFCGTGRNGRDHDIYLYDLASTGPAKMVRRAEGMLNPVAFSPDNTKLLVQKYISERQTMWFVLNIQNKAFERITPESPQHFHGGGAWGADGKAVYLFSDCRDEFRRLFRIDLANNTWHCLTPDIPWDVEAVSVDPGGTGIAFVVNEDGISRLYFSGPDGANRKPVRLPGEGVKITDLTCASAGGVFGFTLAGMRSPGDAYTADFPDGGVRRWTQSETGGLKAGQLCRTTMLRYPTFDRTKGKPRMIPAFIMRGRGQGVRPVVIHAHGGPEFQYFPVFDSTFQYWAAELGITVISPNIRGSTGYGRTFHQLDNGVKREDAVRDIGALLDWIDKQPDLDKHRIGIFGGSYGGYLVLGSLLNYPDRITCGIDVVGVADFVKFLEQTSEYRRDLRRVEYGDERDPQVRKVLESISPLRHVNKINVPLFVLHGEKDTRVPIAEAQQVVARLREMKRPVWFATALDEGHVFHKKQNRDLASIMYTVFWQTHLLPQP